MTLREKGAWLGVIVGALGWILSLAVLARGGGYLVVVPRLAVSLPLAAVGTVTALAAFGVARRHLNAVHWFGVVVLFGLFWNFLVYWMHFGSATWGLLIPLVKPTGVDFRDGLYDPALAFSTRVSGWPPLTLLLGRPFTLFGFTTGYAINVVLLVALAVAAAVVSALLAARLLGARGSEDGLEAGLGGPAEEPARPPRRDALVAGLRGLAGRRVTAAQIGVVAGLWLVTSCGFMYEVERGNIDLYALFFALLAVWLMLRLPRSPWWPTVALAISINLKLYPGVLLLLLFWRYRWRAVVPAVLANGVLLLAGGPANIINTLSGQSTVQSNEIALWWGNHSARAVAHVLHQVYGTPDLALYVPLLLVPLALWALTMVLLMRRGWSDRTAVMAAAACVPVMSVVPSISHDYKLVLYVFPLAVLAACVSVLPRRDLLAWSLAFGFTGWALVGLARSSLVVAPAFLTSKYALVVLVQVLLAMFAWSFSAGRPGAVPIVPAASDRPSPERVVGDRGAELAGDASRSARGITLVQWPTRRVVCVILLLLAAVLGANFWLSLVGNTFNDTNSGIGVPQHDFFQYYAGGHNWRLGLDPYLNHPDAPDALQHSRHDDRSISGYIYPPTLLPLFGALARTDYDTARAVWLALDVSAFALLILVGALVSRGRRLEVVTAAVLLTMVSFPFFYHVHEGQIDMLVAALAVSGFLLYPRWRGWPSAALLALAVAIKVSPILLVAVVCLYFRDWRFLLKVLACGAAVFLTSLVAVDWALYREYVLDILPKISGSDPSPYNQTPLRFWAKYPAMVKAGSALGYLALLFLVWVTGRNSRRVPQEARRVDLRTERNGVLLLAVVLMLLFSPLAWQMAYVWAIVPMALVLTAPPPRGKEWAVLLLAVGAALLSLRMWPYRGLDMTNMIGGAVTAVCLLLYYLPLDLEKEATADAEEPE